MIMVTKMMMGIVKMMMMIDDGDDDSTGYNNTANLIFSYSAQYIAKQQSEVHCLFSTAVRTIY